MDVNSVKVTGRGGTESVSRSISQTSISQTRSSWTGR